VIKRLKTELQHNQDQEKKFSRNELSPNYRSQALRGANKQKFGHDGSDDLVGFLENKLEQHERNIQHKQTEYE
jgi:hypothetical protein